MVGVDPVIRHGNCGTTVFRTDFASVLPPLTDTGTSGEQTSRHRNAGYQRILLTQTEAAIAPRPKSLNCREKARRQLSRKRQH